MSERPGIMIYFDDVLPILSIAGDEDAGRFFRAMVHYGKTGEVPDFSNSPTLAMAWGFVQAKLDRDAAKYYTEVEKRRYAAYCREVKKTGEEPLSFNEWYHMMSDDTTRYPTVTETVTETVTASGNGKVPVTPTKTTTATAAAAGKGEGITGGGTPPPPPPSRENVDWDEYEKMRKSWRPY